MSHNFKVPAATTGTTYYVSKAGHDSNDGLAPERPKRTVANYGTTNDTIIIGSGYYKCSPLSADTRFFFADGKVILDYESAGNNTSLNANASYTDFEIRNAGLGLTGTSRTFLRCLLVNCTGGTASVATGRGHTFNSCIISGGNVGTTSNFISRCINCIIVDGAIVSISNGNTTNALQNSYVQSGCQVNVGTVTISQITNNDIQGIVRISGVDYEVKRNKAGATINPTPSLADLSTASGWSNIYAQANWNQDPMFNNSLAGNYTLQADSPLIRAAANGVDNLGGYFAQVATLIQNTDNGNAAGVRVIASPEIDTTIPNAYKLKTTPVNGFIPIAGYVDYIFPSNGLTIARLIINDLFQFDSDFDSASGTTYIQNNNVVDAQPEQRSGINANTTGYAARTVQLGNAVNNTTLNFYQGFGPAAIVPGMQVRVNGMVRNVVAVSSSTAAELITVTVDIAFPAPITANTTITYGTSSQIAALNPNRLTVLMRTSNSTTPPTVTIDAFGYPSYVDAEWNNELDGGYNANGRFFQQEIDQRPGHIINGTNVWGRGDSEAPTGIPPRDLAPRYCHVRVYKRNDYSSNGNPQ